MITNIKCLIIDDDELDRLVLLHYLKQYESIEIIACLESAEKAAL
ncbi:hypothetical protein SAMN05880574_10661 [Chryseobacterium sp. RU37D]|nr:hypothetical protein [Chryseobacterium sp. RU37D]SIQ13143.1 hypothetical protein SAMN05880574_10661 [Chryseobacterium sp. RU37D]